MAILASDTFIRANQSNLGTSSDGQVWTHPTGSDLGAIVSNQANFTFATQTYNLWQIGTKNAANIECLARFKGDASINYYGFIVRYQSSANYYLISAGESSLIVQIGTG